jgi:hypothetical protein
MNDRDEFDDYDLNDEPEYDGGGVPDVDDDALAPERPPVAGGLAFESVAQFVDEYLLAMYRRAVSGNDTTWCAEWWKHSEAVIRLDALWRSWEYQRADAATGMSVWLRDHCDYHMRVLLSADGPFKGCTHEQHSTRPLKPLPSSRMPEQLAAQLQTANDRQLAKDLG